MTPEIKMEKPSNTKKRISNEKIVDEKLNLTMKNGKDYAKVFKNSKILYKTFFWTDKENAKRDEESTAFLCPEGVFVRMWACDNDWIISTNRKIYATEHRHLARESYGALFLRAIGPVEDFQANLDKNLIYNFYLLNMDENRIVCYTPENPTVFFVNAVDRTGKDVSSSLSIPSFFESFKTDLTDPNETDPRDYQGLVFRHLSGRFTKVFSDNYRQYFELRGTTPSIRFRYLEVRKNDQDREDMYQIYREYNQDFDDYENILLKISKRLYSNYIERYIKKQYISLPKTEFKVIENCHAYHTLDRTNNRVYLDKVIDVVNELPASTLNHLIKEFQKPPPPTPSVEPTPLQQEGGFKPTPTPYPSLRKRTN